MKVALVGAGLIGQSIAHLLRETGDFDVVAFDRDEHALALIDAQGIPTRRVDSADTPALRQALIGFDALINALPYYLAINVASAAKAAGVHYFDLTEDVRATHAIRAIADDSELYALDFDPVVRASDFTERARQDYLVYALEQRHALEHDAVAPDIRREVDALMASDVLMLVFPLYWFSVPSLRTTTKAAPSETT